ncbi:uncharacterized protein F4822DRAFT_444470 [Hypoxylon trugodes]|uniref:uncharacterized protein n=1 Tax=Hypoxylon trugodes TaxID=326681 RepID=UPI00218E92E4|nr:uncharacterized protein F4822DRAFT_444470 [Hypoxylon trugodes]KAI1387998.1 hypothetical protein F4822DRAFT_444470 [Hypoxylon trugodes]
MGASQSSQIFVGKRREIKKQIEIFWKYPSARSDVDAYYKNAENHQYTKPPGYKGLRWIEKKTPFTDWKDKILAHNDKVIIIRNEASPDIRQYTKGEEHKAGMSLIHVLIISKENLFNGVSLDSTNADIIPQGIDLFKTSWDNDPSFRQAVLDHQVEMIRKRDRNVDIAMGHFEKMKEKAQALRADDFTFGLHLSPDHSVPHFHIHAIATPKEFRKHSTKVHDKKTKDVLEVYHIAKNRTNAPNRHRFLNAFMPRSWRGEREKSMQQK